MQPLAVSGAVRPLYGPLGDKGLITDGIPQGLFIKNALPSISRIE